ncbi:alpha-L-rhamnosidase [Rhodococcoides fascians]|uniref:alpha-L-rhamnosidase n=1 Tax=Rhodococcoides fascians TaxID=1828 RepID=UPI000AA5D32A|nr:alpha-L-rhamnosidase [Rhodococcus fascians]
MTAEPELTTHARSSNPQEIDMIDRAAVFITPTESTGEPDEPASYFRREFDVQVGLVRGTLRVTAIGVVEPRLNGRVVGDEVLAPGWTSYRHRLAVSSHEVTRQLTVGRNVVGAIVGEGWALGRLGWENARNHYADRPALYLEMILEYEDRTVVVVSDDTFRAGMGGLRANSIYDGEVFDARLEPQDWDVAGFDDSSWGSVDIFDWPMESLMDSSAEPIRRTDELAPVSITSHKGGRSIVDFGQNISGRVRFTVEAPHGTTITLRHAEVLTAGELDVETVRTAKATDVFIARGTGRETFEPRFTFHGFRYLEVDGWFGNICADDLRAIVVHSDMIRTGWFETSNPLVNRLHDNAVWSMRDNFVGVPTDCPQRDERLGWTGDINAFAPTAAYLFDVRGVLGSWLEDLAAEQREKGFVPWVVPDVLSTPSSPTALWSDVAVSLPWVLYQEYGDINILRRAYPSMTAFVDSVETLLDMHGLWSSGFQFGDWLDPDAPIGNPAGGKTDRHLVASAYLCKTTRELAHTAELLEYHEDAVRYSALADRVRAAFRREYVTEAGRIVNESATGYALAIAFGILEPDQESHAGNRLASLVAENGFKISTGFAGTPLVADALSSTGHTVEAYAMLMETGCPSFLYPVTMGATTIWERWDSIRPDGTINPSGMTSLNHYALGAIASWLHRVVGGIQLIEPGYRRVRIAPQPGGGLTSASTRHRTGYGDIAVSWTIDASTVCVDVSVPIGVDAEVTLPLHPGGTRIVVGSGDHSWQYERPVEAPAHTMSTSLNELAADPIVWQRITEVFGKHLPGIPIDGSDPRAASMSLNVLLDHIPGASEELRADLENACKRTDWKKEQNE